MRQWPRRFVETLVEDRTRPLQVISVVAAFLLAWWMLHFEVPANPETARAVFYFFGHHIFAAILIFSGTLQLIAVGSPWWVLRFVAASLGATMVSYGSVCFLLTNPNALALPLLLTVFVADFWISARAIADKDLNGTTRRRDE